MPMAARGWASWKPSVTGSRGGGWFDCARTDAGSAAQPFCAFFAEPYQLRCANYVDQYDQWSAQLRPGHVMVGAFDDIRTRPEELLLDVMRAIDRLV